MCCAVHVLHVLHVLHVHVLHVLYCAVHVHVHVHVLSESKPGDLGSSVRQKYCLILVQVFSLQFCIV